MESNKILRSMRENTTNHFRCPFFESHPLRINFSRYHFFYSVCPPGSFLVLSPSTFRLHTASAASLKPILNLYHSLPLTAFHSWVTWSSIIVEIVFSYVSFNFHILIFSFGIQLIFDLSPF